MSEKHYAQESTTPDNSKIYERLNKITKNIPLFIKGILLGNPYTGRNLSELNQKKLFDVLDQLEYVRLDYDIIKE